jgi:hypothetical protein
VERFKQRESVFTTILAVDREVTTEPNRAGGDNRSTASPVTLEVP